MTLYTESTADQTDHFTDAFVHEKAAYGYDIRKFTSDDPTPFPQCAQFYAQNDCLSGHIGNFNTRFSCSSGVTFSISSSSG